MRRLKLVLEYDGTAYHGWQVQPGLDTDPGSAGGGAVAVGRGARPGDGGGADGRRGARPRPGGELYRDAAPRRRRTAAGAERAPAARHRGRAASRRCRRTSTRDAPPDPRRTATRCSGATYPSALAARYSLYVPYAAGSGAPWPRRRGAWSAPTTSRRFAPGPARRRTPIRTVTSSRLAGGGRSVALRDRRQRVPPAHGAHHRGDPARDRAGEAAGPLIWRRFWRRATAAPPARRRSRTGCVSCRSSIEPGTRSRAARCRLANMQGLMLHRADGEPEDVHATRL